MSAAAARGGRVVLPRVHDLVGIPESLIEEWESRGRELVQLIVLVRRFREEYPLAEVPRSIHVLEEFAFA
ncbi:MAG TPA: hypothetical protein VGV89_10410 [Thermoplasmata archaeon]|nr:hypothetical protein [Thermoplasmata archaeon]